MKGTGGERGHTFVPSSLGALNSRSIAANVFIVTVLPLRSRDISFPSLTVRIPKVVSAILCALQWAAIRSAKSLIACSMTIYLGYCPDLVKDFSQLIGHRLKVQESDMDTKVFRKMMVEAMDAQKLSVAEVARRAGLKYDNIRDLIRREDSTTSIDKAAKIAKALGFSVDTATDGGFTNPPWDGGAVPDRQEHDNPQGTPTDTIRLSIDGGLIRVTATVRPADIDELIRKLELARKIAG